jgi:hypothetical protein
MYTNNRQLLDQIRTIVKVCRQMMGCPVLEGCASFDMQAGCAYKCGLRAAMQKARLNLVAQQYRELFENSTRSATGKEDRKKV